jgi:hypothetical protein
MHNGLQHGTLVQKPSVFDDPVFCFTKDNGPCHKLVTTPEHAPVIVATLEDLKKSRTIAHEKGWEMYANDLGDQIDGMEKVLSEFDLPTEKRKKNRGGR